MGYEPDIDNYLGLDALLASHYQSHIGVWIRMVELGSVYIIHYFSKLAPQLAMSMSWYVCELVKNVENYLLS